MVLRQRLPSLPVRPCQRAVLDVRPSEHLELAQAEWVRGNARKAVAAAWDAVNRAMDRGDDSVMRGAAELARTIAGATSGSVAEEARRLTDYCDGCLAGVGSGTQAESLLNMITGWRRRRSCPDCAESIARNARVCPHCGYRLAPPPTTS